MGEDFQLTAPCTIDQTEDRGGDLQPAIRMIAASAD
jgi:hypothetical protein